MPSLLPKRILSGHKHVILDYSDQIFSNVYRGCQEFSSFATDWTKNECLVLKWWNIP